jgi:hypothetical protein
VTFDCNSVARSTDWKSSDAGDQYRYARSLCKVTGLVKMDSVAKGIKRWLPGNAEGNIKAARAAYERA